MRHPRHLDLLYQADDGFGNLVNIPRGFGSPYAWVNEDWLRGWGSWLEPGEWRAGVIHPVAPRTAR